MNSINTSPPYDSIYVPVAKHGHKSSTQTDLSHQFTRMKILILGGGKFVDRALTEASTSRGHDVTTFTRSTLPPGAEMGAIETIFADRTDEHAFDFAKNRHWGAIFDTWRQRRE